MTIRSKSEQSVLDTLLHEAISARDLRACRLLLKDGANPDAEPEQYAADGEASLCTNDSVPLLRAIRLGFTQGAILLVASGATLTAMDADAKTTVPLELAARKNQEDICRTLLAAGAPVDEAGYDGNTALIMASVNGCVEACRALIEHGADVNIRNTSGYTPVMFAAKSHHDGSADVLRLLLATGPSTDAPSGDFAHVTALTAFQSAIAAGATRNVALFLDEHDEDPEQRTRDGRSMFDLSAQDDINALLRAAVAEKSISNAVGATQADDLDSEGPAEYSQLRSGSPAFGTL
jgi:hypothetical protein